MYFFIPRTLACFLIKLCSSAFVYLFVNNSQTTWSHLLYEQRWNVFVAARAGRGGMPWPRLPSSLVSNQGAGTVSRRPRSPNRRKTKPGITTKLSFYTQLRTRIRFSALDLPYAIDPRCFPSLLVASRAMLFICSNGGLETALPCPISSVVFLLSPGFSMLLLQKWGLSKERGASLRYYQQYNRHIREDGPHGVSHSVRRTYPSALPPPQADPPREEEEEEAADGRIIKKARNKINPTPIEDRNWGGWQVNSANNNVSLSIKPNEGCPSVLGDRIWGFWGLRDCQMESSVITQVQKEDVQVSPKTGEIGCCLHPKYSQYSLLCVLFSYKWLVR